MRQPKSPNCDSDGMYLIGLVVVVVCFQPDASFVYFRFLLPATRHGLIITPTAEVPDSSVDPKHEKCERAKPGKIDLQ